MRKIHVVFRISEVYDRFYLPTLSFETNLNAIKTIKYNLLFRSDLLNHSISLLKH